MMQEGWRNQMFVKIYHYHIPKEKTEEFLKIQERAAELYGRYVEFETSYLHDKDDETKWLEVTRYKDEDVYRSSMKLLDKEEELHTLFKDFNSLLISEIKEEDYLEMNQIAFLKTERGE
jgi:hypothetical protein